MIKIDGVTIKTPDLYKPGIMDITKGERNANGDMVLDLIATKRKLELGWTYLTASELSTLLNMIEGKTLFSVEYPDPETGGMKTGTFYKGDRNIEGMTYKNGSMVWKNCKFNVIER